MDFCFLVSHCFLFSEKKKLDKTFADKVEFLKHELHLLEEELRSITAPVEMLSSLMTSSPSSVPLSVASATATPDTGDIIDDMRDDSILDTIFINQLKLDIHIKVIIFV